MTKDLPRRLGILIPEFPGMTHVLFSPSIRELRRRKVDLVLLSTRRNGSPCPHPELQEMAAKCTYAVPFTLPTLWELFTKPLSVWKSIQYILQLAESSWLERLKTCSLIPPAVHLARQCRRLSVSHVHCHSFASAAHLINLMVFFEPVTISVVLHGDLPIYGKDFATKIKNMKFIAAVTEPLARDLARVSPQTPPILVLPEGIDLAQWEMPSSVSSKPSTTKCRFVTAARLTLAKGHRVALRAMRRLVEQGITDFDYRIMGAGDLEATLLSDIRELGLEKYVKLLGPVSSSELKTIYQSSDVFVIASFGLGEATCTALREGMACGLAAIATDVGILRESVEGCGICVKANDELALTAALEEMIKKPGLRKEWGSLAHSKAIKEFSAQESVSKLIRAL